MTGFKIERTGPVARLILAKPPLNNLDIPLMQGLATEARRLKALPPAERPRLVVLTSSVPGQFSQGVDPNAVLAADVYGRKEIFLALVDLVEALWFLHIPLLADISGPALAGGAVLATLADFAVIDAQAGKICFSEPKVGLPLPLFGQRLIQRKVNPQAWNEVMILGRNVDATEAQRIGFANGVYSSDSEREELLNSFTARITRLSPAVLSETLRQNRRGDQDLLAGFRADMAAFAEFVTDEYLGKGLKAVLKGESPKF